MGVRGCRGGAGFRGWWGAAGVRRWGGGRCAVWAGLRLQLGFGAVQLGPGAWHAVQLGPRGLPHLLLEGRKGGKGGEGRLRLHHRPLVWCGSLCSSCSGVGPCHLPACVH